mmetsp:Transcript_51003/g.122039  ORF Transcript_51003/g.122039 Transcript_51003/m.122039 type:complete len:378 (-) Transcript_51003:79-1212(-)
MESGHDVDVSLPALWVSFALAILVAASLDACCGRRRCWELPAYAKQLMLWLFAGLCFSVFVTLAVGLDAGASWTYGYFLEYMLSVDNLFVFQLVFKAYSTPEAQLGRALFCGISVAVVLRLAFFAVGTSLLELGFVSRLGFGLLLVYSGIKAFWDDEEEDPSSNCLVRGVARLLPLHDKYSEEPHFFVRVGSGPAPAIIGASEGLHGMMDVEDSKSFEAPDRHGSLKVTPLFLVVVTLALIDVIFAVDSVTAKVSSVNGFEPDVSFFLNLSSSAFAMFVLRSLYLVVDMLTHSFRFLKYGVGFVLIFIGIKLMMSGWFEVSMLLSCVLILSLLLISILASWAPCFKGEPEELREDPPAKIQQEDSVFAIELEDDDAI